MDRLGRRRARLFHLLDESRVKPLFVEMPHASSLELGIRAILAEEEARLISQRTKVALAALKARGKRLGRTGVLRAAENKARAAAFAKKLKPTISALRKEGVTSVRAIAEELNRRGIKSAQGGHWHATSVARLLERI
jgi:DNA invertase Pin-like site-specific DNA recombinase